MKKSTLISIALFTIAFIPLLNAQIPQKMSVQGILTDDQGMAFPDDVYALTFRLYTSPTGGIVAWQETQNAESNNGLFNSLLGEINPLAIPFDRPYFLGISVNGGPELEPRIEMAASAYSLMARSIAPGAINFGSLAINSVSIDNIIPNIISTINGVGNDGGNVELVAGANITITPNDVTNTITISAADQGAGNPGILQINGGNSISIDDNDGPTSTISVTNNSINDNEIIDNSLSANSLASGSVGNAELQSNSVTPDKIVPNIVSSIDGVSNDGGNINLIAGANVTITPNDINNSITISAVDPGNGNPGILQINPGNAIGIDDLNGPTSTISVLPNSIGTQELEADVEFGPAGFVGIRNINNRLVAGLGYNIFDGGWLGLNNSAEIEVVRISNDAIGNGTIDIANSVGRPVAAVYGFQDVGVFSSLNSFSNEVAVLTSFRNSGFVGIADENGAPIAAMEANPLLNGSFSIINDLGNLVAQVTEDGFDNGFIGVGNSTELPVVSMYADGQGNGLFQLGNNLAGLSVEITTSPAGGGLLNIGNANQQIVARVTEEDGAGFVGIADPNENPIAVLHRNQLGDGTLEILNNGARVAQVTEDGFGNGFIGVGNSNELPLVSMYGSGPGSGLLEVYNNQGIIVDELTTDNSGSGRINVFNAQGTESSVVTVNTGGGGDVYVNNTTGLQVGRLTSNTVGGGFLGIANELGTLVGIMNTTQTSDGIFSVHNATGEEMARMGVASNGGYVSADNNNGVDVARVTANNGGGGFIAVDNTISNTVVRMTTGSDYGFLETFDNNGSSVLSLVGANSGGDGYVGISNAGQVQMAHMTTASDGGFVETFNNNGSRVTYMTTNFQDGGRIGVDNSSQTEQARMTTVSDGGYISIDNANGEDVARMNATSSGGGYIVVDNAFGQTVSRLTNSNQGNGWISVDNAGGLEVARMRGLNDGGVFEVINSLGNEASTMTFSTTGGGFVGVNNSSGLTVASVSTNTNTGGFVGISNPSDVSVARMTTLSSGSGYFSIDNSGGTEIIRLTNAAGNGSVSTFGNNGARLTSLTSSTGGDGYIQLNNSSGNERARMTTNTNGGGFVGVRDGAGNERAWMTTNSNGSGSFSTLGPNGSTNFQVGTSSVAGVNAGAVYVFDGNNTLRGQFTANGFCGVDGPNGNRNVTMAGQDMSGHPDHGTLEVYDPNGNDQAGIYVDANSGQGIVWGDVKNFRMADPNNDAKEIWYASLEGPEAAAYFRGTAKLVDGKAVINLPEHFSSVAVNKGLTVQLTPLSAASEGMAVVKKSTSQVVVRELRNGTGNYEFDFIIHAVRNGFEDYKVIREKRQPATRRDSPGDSSNTLIKEVSIGEKYDAALNATAKTKEEKASLSEEIEQEFFKSGYSQGKTQESNIEYKNNTVMPKK